MLAAFILSRTTFGFEIDTVGTNPDAATYAGMNVDRVIIGAMAIAGSFAGLSGVSEVAGTNGFFQPGIFVAMGFDGIAIALLARANPYAIVPAAFLWGSMLNSPARKANARASAEPMKGTDRAMEPARRSPLPNMPRSSDE